MLTSPSVSWALLFGLKKNLSQIHAYDTVTIKIFYSLCEYVLIITELVYYVCFYEFSLGSSIFSLLRKWT